MRSILYSLGVFSLIVGTEALQIFSLPLAKIEPAAREARRRVHRRQFSTPLINQFPLYVVDITIGTPPRKLQVQLDTGSSDLVVQTDVSDYCTSDPTFCSDVGTYNANASSTYRYISSDLDVLYLSGENATGDYASDTVTIGNAALSSFQFGIMYNTTVADNVFGVGFVENEFGTFFDPPRTYPNLPVALVSGGYIPSRTFSLYLNDIQDGSGGTILFGGIDTQKYCGLLSKLPMLPYPGFPQLGIIAFYVDLEGVSGTRNGAPVKFPAGNASLGPAVLDSGTSITVLPDALANQIFALVGASFEPGDDLPTIPCNITAEDIVLHFKFQTISINVSISQLVLFLESTGLCYFGIITATAIGSDTAILGDTFLSSAYTVFDLDNKNIYLAQANFGAVKENIVQIHAGVDGVPQPNGNCNGGSIVTTTTTTPTTTRSTTKSTTRSTTKSTTRSTTRPTTKSTARPTTTKKPITTKKPTSTKTVTTTKKPATTKKPTTTKKIYSSIKPATTAPPKCYQDNCYNALAQEKAAGVNFCSKFIKGKACSTPSRVVSACNGKKSMVSSACSCLPTSYSKYPRR
ncbi:Barrierpepsin [Dactylellina cionopaga]|nr:Barrierpepsin [Dactylellina cionopaga]